MVDITSVFVTVDGLRLHVREGGVGEPVLLLHGWPTSSHLWREILPRVAERNRVIALDLPGFGRSDKPTDASYSFRFHARAIDGVLEQLGVDRLGLAVHDLGGPVGLHWMCQNMERVTRLALLNTIVYPEMSWAVILFVAACRLPLMRDLLTSPWGLKVAMQIGVHDPTRVTPGLIEAIRAPFRTREAREALYRAAYGLHPAGFQEIARRLPDFDGPVCVVYGERDWILPDVAETMARVAADLPQALVTPLPDCGHFLQEDRPDVVAPLLADFFALT